MSDRGEEARIEETHLAEDVVITAEHKHQRHVGTAPPEIIIYSSDQPHEAACSLLQSTHACGCADGLNYNTGLFSARSQQRPIHSVCLPAKQEGRHVGSSTAGNE